MQLRKQISIGLALLLTAGSSAFAASVSNTPAAKSAPARTSSAATKSAASKSAAGKRVRRRRDRGQKAPTADRITEIQQALAKDGTFTAKANGKWDASSIEAMRKFQEAHGLNPTGKIDALSLQKLGLGSQTAGIAAPMPLNSSLNSPAGTNSSTAAAPQPTARPEH